jgi:uncharacterized membrane protein/thiol-disulfide isomerase/thioredoxin
MKRLPLRFVILLIAVWATLSSAKAAAHHGDDVADLFGPNPARGKQRQSNDEAVVTAVLFYSPTCPHCHQVISELLVPMVKEYGDQLQIAGIDTSQMGGSQLYQAAIERYQIPPERHGVPTLVVGDVVLVGGREIPERFPTLFKEGLAAGGIDWPDIPGLAEMLSAAEAEPTTTPTPRATATAIAIAATVPPATPTPLPSPTAAPQTTPTLVPSFTATPAAGLLTIGEDEIPPGEVEEPQADPLGFTLAGAVLFGMGVAVSYATLRLRMAGQRLFQFDRNPVARARTLAIPILVLLGLGVATYLAYVEVSHVEAVCGPVGECNVVQSSDYALMLGIPVAVWGVLNFLAIGALWAGQRQLSGRWANLSALGLLGLTLFGTLFSIYLTCLELFVIRAVCAWCLSSAVITTLLMLLVVVPITGGLSAGERVRR